MQLSANAGHLKLITLCLFNLLAIPSLAIDPEYECSRKWYLSGGGRPIEGEFVSLENGVVKIRQSDGSAVDIPFKKLCLLDQAVAESIAKASRKPRLGVTAGLGATVLTPSDVATVIQKGNWNVLNESQHNKLFSQLSEIQSARKKTIASLRETMTSTEKEIEFLRQKRSVPPARLVKDEFETTAEFETRRRNQVSHAAIIATIDQQLTEASQRLSSIKNAIRDHESHNIPMFEEVVVLQSLKMGQYDADRETVSSFAALVTDVGHSRCAISNNSQLPELSCNRDIARRLRSASDRNDLKCEVKLTKVRLLASAVKEEQRPPEQPSNNQKNAITVGVWVFQSLAGDGGSGVPPMPYNWVVERDYLTIVEYSSARYVRFFDSGGTILDKN